MFTKRSVVGFCCAAVLSSWHGVVPPLAGQEPWSDRIQEIEELLLEKMREAEIPGLSVAIAVDGRLVWANGYGLANVENSVPAAPETAYRSASIGKPMTATAVMQLVEQGRLDPDDPVQHYCPAFPEKRWELTTRQLLSHLGGIRHYGGERNEEELYSTTHYDGVVDALEIFKNDSLLFEPGTQYLYSTYGYNVLGCVIEGASREMYLTYMERHVFGPAGMKSTRDDDPSAIIPHRAGGYRLLPTGELANARQVDMSNKMPAGGFITTAPDLVAFASAAMDGTLIREETFARMIEPQRTASGEVLSYGIGWGLFPDDLWYGEKEAFHGGGTPGVSGFLYLLPGRRFAVAILANLEDVEDRVGLAAQIARIALGLDDAGHSKPDLL